MWSFYDQTNIAQRTCFPNIAQRTGFYHQSGALQVLAKLSSLFPQQAGVMPDFAPPEAPQ